MSQWQVIDALNGSLLTAEYLQEAAGLGVMALNITVNNFDEMNHNPSFTDAMRLLANFRSWLAKMDKYVVPVTKTSDLERAFATRKVGIIMCYQNVPIIGNKLELLSLFHALGIRIIQLTHNERNLFGDGCNEPANAGLSSLGRNLVKEMNRLGIVIDLSHVGEASSLEALEISTQPVAITHANALTLASNARNKSDRVLDALATNNGVIGATFLPPFVSPRGPKSTFDDVVAQVEYIAGRIGARHVGIGSEFITGHSRERFAHLLRKPEIYGEWPWKWAVSGFPELNELFEALLRRGYSEDDVRGIAGGNFRRLFEQVWSKTGNPQF